MKCVKCGADYGSELTNCPYCGELNLSAVKYANVLQGYNEDFERTRDALTEKGASKPLKYVTFAMIGLYVIVLAITIIIVTNVNNVVTGKSSIVKNSSAQQANEALFEDYMSKGEYHRALDLVNQTDLSMYQDELTGFEYYSEYKDSLECVFPYVNIYNEVLFVTDALDKGEDYRSFTGSQATSYHIFYGTPDSDLKAELQVEIEDYLRNLYMLTDEEIADLRTRTDYLDFTEFRIEGSMDYETITKERMVEHFGK